MNYASDFENEKHHLRFEHYSRTNVLVRFFQSLQKSALRPNSNLNRCLTCPLTLLIRSCWQRTWDDTNASLTSSHIITGISTSCYSAFLSVVILFCFTCDCHHDSTPITFYRTYCDGTHYLWHVEQKLSIHYRTTTTVTYLMCVSILSHSQETHNVHKARLMYSTIEKICIGIITGYSTLFYGTTLLI